MSSWTSQETEIAREIVEREIKTNAHLGRLAVGCGYRAAAVRLNTTPSAIRCLLARAAKRSIPYRLTAKAEEQPAPEPPRDVLDSYVSKANDRAERLHIANLEREVFSLREALDVSARLASAPLPPIARHEMGSGLREGTAVALLSDCHVEEHVLAGDTPVGNVYNPVVADKSLARFFAAYRWLIKFHRHAFQIRHAILWLGGDLMTGHIHEENVETTRGQTPIETLLWLQARIVAGIDSLLDDSELETLYVPCSYGNHGRNSKKPMRARGAAHSYEWLLYQWLASHYAGTERVRFLADPSAHQYLTAYQFDLHFHHGDEINYQGGIGGVTIPANKKVAKWDIARRCHYHHFGHFHQYIPGGRLIFNGSVIGYNAYAMSIGAEPEPAQQTFYVLDSKRGKICKSPIWVRD